jgi:hypothetical protein
MGGIARTLAYVTSPLVLTFAGMNPAWAKQVNVSAGR